jgi:hypothetical protein
MPTPTDLVTDLPADFEVFGQAVATSMADLLGGTSGQILAKNSNTDMDFVWIANDQGDITGITASSPLTGGGTSGAVTIGILNGTTSNLGAVQLSDSTSSTSTTLAATANAVKTSYDLANAAIPKSLIDAAGDLIVGTAADTVGRIAIGTTGQVLTVAGGTATWATPAAGGGGKVLQVVHANTTTAATSSSATHADTNLTATITPTSATSKVLVLVNQNGLKKSADASNTFLGLKLLRGATVISTFEDTATFTGTAVQNRVGGSSVSYLDSPATTSATTYKTTFASGAGTTSVTVQEVSAMSTITLLEIGA